MGQGCMGNMGGKHRGVEHRGAGHLGVGHPVEDPGGDFFF